jgi:uncharacterized protein
MGPAKFEIMKMNKSITLALLLLVVGVMLIIRPTPGPVFEELPVQVLSITTPEGKTHNFNVELATTPEQLRDGLMFRTKLADDAGMLFVFQTVEPVSFWMKNTLIPLDMLFIKPDGTLAKVHANAQPNDETGIPSEVPVRAVLEIRGGRATELGVVAGSRISGLPWLSVENPAP